MQIYIFFKSFILRFNVSISLQLLPNIFKLIILHIEIEITNKFFSLLQKILPTLYNYFPTSSKKDYFKFSQLAWNLLPRVWRIGIKYGCGGITKDAGNIMRAIYHSYPLDTLR